MKKTVVSGRTIEDAVTSALVRLGVTRDQASVRVIQEPVRARLGLFGGREAIVEVTVLPSPGESVRQFLTELLRRMGIQAFVRIRRAPSPGQLTATDGQAKQEPVEVEIAIECDDATAALVIGRHGATLDALQFLASLVAGRELPCPVRVHVDCCGYRQRRREQLERLAEQAAERALRSRRPVKLDAMPAAERRWVHMYLQDRQDVTTASEGAEPHRRVVVFPVHEPYN
ncbi:MAG: Jag N-terminal domain-containing protein [Alicyclobacillus sp.]|nr:Jag N-terminal domain-containing protein [Alicyclobacillus sp.]